MFCIYFVRSSSLKTRTTAKQFAGRVEYLDGERLRKQINYQVEETTVCDAKQMLFYALLWPFNF